MPGAEQVVRDFCAALATLDADRVRPFLATDVRFRDPGTDVTGVEATLQAFAPVFAMFAALDVRVVHLASSGNVVFVERTDVVTVGDTTAAVDVVALFEVGNSGRIVRWYDYFDARQVAALMRPVEPAS